jgi:hypothetical protein
MQEDSYTWKSLEHRNSFSSPTGTLDIPAQTPTVGPHDMMAVDDDDVPPAIEHAFK